MYTHADHAAMVVEQLAQPGHGFVLATYKNHILEKLAEQHGLNSKETDQDRRNRQQDQRQRHHPRRFMRFLTRRQTMMMVRRFLFVGVVTMMRMQLYQSAPRRGTRGNTCGRNRKP
jgi:hypothetical protein